MSDEELLSAFKKWKDQVGRSKGLSELTFRQVCPRTADLLMSDDYKHKPRRKLRAALVDILKTG